MTRHETHAGPGLDRATYQRVKELYYAWCEADHAARGAQREALVGEPEAVRRAVESMIEEDAGADATSFLDAPVFGVDVMSAVLDEADPERGLPESIGAYRIVRRLGVGGMGVVYEAEQEHPHRTVALKVIRPGVASPRTLRRFEFEAQILGRLQHPGIAPIFEAGTFDDGHGVQPYFAMEFVRGRPLLEYVEAHDLEPRERLLLLARIAHAVQHAHQHGVVHRDLKPDNILVEEREATDAGASTTFGGAGQPKVLDFGVARVTDADLQATTVRTDVGQLVGTIPYMSPEQARGRRDDVDQRSDVYALGVIGYEMLAGRRPHDLAGLSVAEAVRTIEEDEPTPLGSIDRRLRGDVETIIAKAIDRDPERRYVTAAALAADIERYLGDQPIVARPPSTVYQLGKFARRNKALVGGSAIALLALIVGFAMTSIALRNALASAEAARHEQWVAGQVSAFLQETLAAVDPFAGDARDLRDLLDRAAQRAFVELETPQVAAPVHMTIGNAYLALAVYDEADRHFTRARELAERGFGAESAESADAIEALGRLRVRTSNYAEAESLLRETLALRRRLDPRDDVAIGNTLRRLGNVLKHRGEYTDAEKELRAALVIHEAALGPDAAVVATDRDDLGILLIDTNDLEEAETLVRGALETRERVFGREGVEVAQSHQSLGWLFRRAERHAESEAEYRHALEIYESILEPDHPTIGDVTERIAAAVGSQGRLDEAEPLYRRALDVQRQRQGPRHRDVGTTLNNIAGLCRKLGRYAEAIDLYDEALSIYREQIGPDHVWTAIVLENLARTHELAGDLDAAEPYLDDCLRIRRAYFGARDEGLWPIAIAEAMKAQILAHHGRYDEAESMMRGAIETLETERGLEHGATQEAVRRAIEIYERWKRPERADAMRAKLRDEV